MIRLIIEADNNDEILNFIRHIAAKLGSRNEATEFQNAPSRDDMKSSIGQEQQDEVDVFGLPWDARIHSVGRTKHKDGRWRLKRNVDQERVSEVERELFESVTTKIQTGGCGEPGCDYFHEPPQSLHPDAPADQIDEEA
ncbi:MAG: hypothetical protein HQL95_07110 [Magnetococcales bacterium]|nr:hypothetical protein [Magnetococcales bacterium]